MLKNSHGRGQDGAKNKKIVKKTRGTKVLAELFLNITDLRMFNLCPKMFYIMTVNITIFFACRNANANINAMMLVFNQH